MTDMSHEMTSEILENAQAHIETMKARWMTGGSAETSCPSPWLEALNNPTDLDLLALAGQFSAVATRPVLSGEVSERPLLPKLSLPPMPENACPLFIRAMEANKSEAMSIITLAASRGYVASPMDWMPPLTASDVPDVYIPWIDWKADAKSGTNAVKGAGQIGEGSGEGDAWPSVETWDEWAPQARLAAVNTLRKSNPDAGRDLIADVAPTLAAEPRLRLVSILATGLCQEDEEFLCSLDNDRSAKVKAMAKQLLGRLGKVSADAENVAELAAFFEVKKVGILSRRKKVTARKLKTDAQRKRRLELAESLPLDALAWALKMSGDQLIESWQGHPGAEEITAMVVATGTDGQVMAMLEKLLQNTNTHGVSLPLFERLEPEARLHHAQGIARLEEQHFNQTIVCLGSCLGEMEYGVLAKSAMMKLIKPLVIKEELNYTIRHKIDETLFNLGLIASQDAALRLIDDFQNLGMMAVDPRLSLLRLNAMLPPEHKTTP